MGVLIYFLGSVVYLIGLYLDLFITKQPLENFWKEVLLSLIWPLWFVWAVFELIFEIKEEKK